MCCSMTDNPSQKQTNHTHDYCGGGDDHSGYGVDMTCKRIEPPSSIYGRDAQASGPLDTFKWGQLLPLGKGSGSGISFPSIGTDPWKYFGPPKSVMDPFQYLYGVQTPSYDSEDAVVSQEEVCGADVPTLAACMAANSPQCPPTIP